MNANVGMRRDRRARLVVLWVCVGVFLLRVLGQLEVVLIAPAWLPPMEQWYSGLLPYPVLLPAQIIILMVMTGLVVAHTRRSSDALADRESRRNWLGAIALLYFAAMLSRLIIQYMRGADNLIAAGGIPVAFHWVLALFLLVLSKAGRYRPTGPKELELVRLSGSEL